jgi:hypothetical protein
MPLSAETSSEPDVIICRIAWASFQALFWEIPINLPRYTEEMPLLELTIK